jgi:hypothetical protein
VRSAHRASKVFKARLAHRVRLALRVSKVFRAFRVKLGRKVFRVLREMLALLALKAQREIRAKQGLQDRRVSRGFKVSRVILARWGLQVQQDPLVPMATTELTVFPPIRLLLFMALSARKKNGLNR